MTGCAEADGPGGSAQSRYSPVSGLVNLRDFTRIQEWNFIMGFNGMFQGQHIVYLRMISINIHKSWGFNGIQLMNSNGIQHDLTHPSWILVGFHHGD